MKLVVVKGSPKPKPGNTEMLLDHFLAGVRDDNSHEIRVFSVNDFPDAEAIESVFGWADHFLLAFPLYTDAMPSGINRFIQRLGFLSQKDSGTNPRMLFLVQSGFIEATHSRGLERYLEKLTGRLNCEYGGTVIRGGIESIRQFLPPAIGLRIIGLMEKGMRKLGRRFGRTGRLDPKTLRRLAFPEKMPTVGVWFFNIYSKIGIHYMGFDRVLKQGNVFDIRDARPYN